ncbi:manganese catalase family protein [Paenibacillus sp. GbtcB18]|uniref:manganese catalase family protein n=1 Tax=Paenibacillus sp. GbtcB18 TaxID=2824763 RepID=UPI002671B4A9|nr:manganese catalase family protein [Paenibacillus sp. GbtcB18]
MFRHQKELQFEVKVDRPDPMLARQVQEVLGGQFGEMTVMMQYLFQKGQVPAPKKVPASELHHDLDEWESLKQAVKK